MTLNSFGNGGWSFYETETGYENGYGSGNWYGRANGFGNGDVYGYRYVDENVYNKGNGIGKKQ